MTDCTNTNVHINFHFEAELTMTLSNKGCQKDEEVYNTSSSHQQHTIKSDS